MKLVRPGILLTSVALAIVAPLSASAGASSPGVQAPTGTITGTVTGLGSAPVAGACVSISGENLQLPTVHTSASGGYSFTGLTTDPSAGYIVSVDPSCSSVAQAKYYEPVYSSVLVTSAAAVIVNVQLVLGGSITGSVANVHGSPILNVCIRADAADDSGGSFAQSAADGTFTMTGVPPGTYIVTIDGCNGIEVEPTENVQPQYYNSAQDLSSATPVVVTVGATTALAPQTLTDAGEIDLTFTPPAGVTLAELFPEITPVDSPANALEVDNNTDGPDANGLYRFLNLMPVAYTISYFYCPLSGGVPPCRDGVDFYKGQGLDGTPTVVTPTPGVLQTLTDTVVIPPFVSSTTTLGISAGPYTAGQSVTFTATVTPASGSHVPTGPVYFSDLDSNFGDPGNISGQVPLDAAGVATLVVPAVGAGDHSIVASYVGDGGLASSESSESNFTVAPAPAGGGGGGGAPTAPVTATVPADGSVSSDPAGATADASNPLVVGVTSPTGGTVTIDKTPPDTAVANYTVLGVGATITAPPATTADPLTLTFQVFDKKLSAGSGPADLTVFRDGVAVGACTGVGATPDPCVASATTSGGVTTIVILSSHASKWDVEAASVGRVSGTDRIATAVAVSQDSFPAGNAGAVVLARGDDYPDALVGGPLAAAKNAPLLLTEGSTLPVATATELRRVLPAGGTVYVLGGTSAVPAAVASQLTSLGYGVVRYSGADRYATAVAVAKALGSPTTVLLATGTNFPDALAAGPAAAHVHGAILLTNGSTVPTETATYLAGAHTTYAIGGPAAAAAPSATAILGSDRYATAAAVATRFFPSSTVVGVATGAGFPDALAGGAQLALMGAPLLLSSLASVPTSTSNYLNSDHSVLTNVYVYGGTAVLGANVVAQLTAAFGS
jgi:putative cell wall-binding protein